MSAPVRLGMNNPLASDPDDALVCWPEGCTGHRVYEMLRAMRPALDEDAYLAMFDRRNLLPGREWSDRAAREAGLELRAHLSGLVAVLGAKTWAALGLPRREWLGHARFGGAWWYRVPHPSGLNQWYNDATNRRAAAALLLQLADFRPGGAA